MVAVEDRASSFTSTIKRRTENAAKNAAEDQASGFTFAVRRELKTPRKNTAEDRAAIWFHFCDEKKNCNRCGKHCAGTHDDGANITDWPLVFGGH